MSIRNFRNLLVLTVLIIFSACANAQCITKKNLKKLAAQVNKYGKPVISGDSVMQMIRKSGSLTIGYTEYNNTSRHSPVTYYIISLSKTNCTAYKYTKQETVKAGDKPFRLDTLKLSASITDSLPEVLKTNAPWKINHDETADDDPCSHNDPMQIRTCNIHDATSKALLLLTPTHQASSSYYAPDYYEYTCCPGNPERQRFLKVISFIYSAFANLKPGN
jgi:hypothetical protein